MVRHGNKRRYKFSSCCRIRCTSQTCHLSVLTTVLVSGLDSAQRPIIARFSRSVTRRLWCVMQWSWEEHKYPSKTTCALHPKKKEKLNCLSWTRLGMTGKSPTSDSISSSLERRQIQRELVPERRVGDHIVGRLYCTCFSLQTLCYILHILFSVITLLWIL